MFFAQSVDGERYRSKSGMADDPEDAVSFKTISLPQRSLNETKRPIFEGAYRKAHCDDNVQAVYAPVILKRISSTPQSKTGFVGTPGFARRISRDASDRNADRKAP